VGAVDECFAEVELAALDQVVGEPLQRILQDAFIDPSLEPTKARSVRRIPLRHVGPGSAGAQDPENAVEHVARVAPRSTATVFANDWLRQQRLDCGPLLVGEVHLDLRSRTRSSVDRGQISLNSRAVTKAGL